jgi:phospholipid-transporting ATPase
MLLSADVQKRHRQDRHVNRKKTNVLRDGQWTRVRWMNVVVGDYVRVENNEAFPADLLLLSSRWT